MMKAAVLLLVVASASAQNYNYYATYGYSTGGGAIIFPDDYVPAANLPVRPTGVVRPSVLLPVRPTRPVSPQQPVGPFQPVQPLQPVQPSRPVQPSQPIQASCSGGIVHATLGNSEYHFSWCADRTQNFNQNIRNYTSEQANGYCAGLELGVGGWSGISIEDPNENNFVSQIINAYQLDYIWTSGRKQFPGSFFVWATGRQVTYSNWSHTGFDNLPQPDNREGNAENCLAVLNNFYQDGIRWHDIACHHTKPIICERATRFG